MTLRILSVLSVVMFAVWPLAATVSAQTADAASQPLLLSRPLYIGISGSDVADLQRFLKSEGLFSHPRITGFFGTITKDSVTRFQTDRGIDLIGEVGPLTRLALTIRSLQKMLAHLAPTNSLSAVGPLASTTNATSTGAIATSTLVVPIYRGGSGGFVDTSDSSAPSAPTGLARSAADASVTLTWTDPSDNDLETITIYRGTTSGSLSLLTTVAAGAQTFTDSPLSNGTTYYYALSAGDADENESDRTSEVSATPVGEFDLYVDSSGGNDVNDGTSSYEAFATLAAAQAAAIAEGDGVTIGLKSGSVWREGLDLSTVDNVTVEAVGTGTPPVITGFDVKTGWTQDGTHTNLWYVDITHDTSGSNRPVVLDNDELMYRRTSAALANSNEGSYYSADAGSANPLRVYINPVGDPNSDGHTYEVTTRNTAIHLGEGATLEGVVARGAMSNNGPIEAGIGSTLRRCVAAYGTKHNILLASGTIEDCVMYESDAASASESGHTMFVGFTPDATGLSLSLTRLLAYTERPITNVVYAHTLNDPADTYASITCDSCIAHLPTGGGSGISGGPLAFSILNSSLYGAINSAVTVNFGPSSTVLRLLAEQRTDSPNEGGSDSASWSQIAIARTFAGGGSQSPIKVVNGSDVTVDHATIATPASFFGYATGWVSGTTGSLALNRSLLTANSAVGVPNAASYGTSNNNVFVRTSIGPFVTYHGTNYDLSSQMAAYRATTTQETNSIALTSSAFTGTPATGDFRINAAALTGAGHDGDAGVTEHWDYNLRQVVAGPPQEWPVIPTTYEEALEYIQDPEAWNF